MQTHNTISEAQRPCRGGFIARRSMVVLIAWMVVAAGTAPAAERWQPFLEGLRDRGMHDMAVLYLDRMAADPDCPADLREVIDYEAGITLMTGSRGSRRTAFREQSLDKARVRFEKFLKEHPDHELGSLATSQLANVLIERGRIRAERAERPSTPPKQKKRLLAEAREFYSEAYDAFEKARQRYVAILKGLDAAWPAETSLKEQTQARRNLLQTRLFLATAVHEIAMTYPPGSPEREAKLVEAAKQYRALFEQFGNRLAGLHARLLEGRCYQELGQYDKATFLFDELLNRPDNTPAIHELTNKTLVLALETLVDPKVASYASALKKYDRWRENIQGGDESSDDGLAIKYFAAEACLGRAESLKKDDPERAGLLVAARGLLQSVARLTGDYQAKAKLKLLDPRLSNSDDQATEPADFAAARDRADMAKDRMQAADLQDRLDRTQGDPKNHERYAEEIAQSRAEAFKYYRKALALATSETPTDEVNRARYYLAYLHWMQQDRYDAAVLGEFLARRYHDRPVAPGAAKIAMVAYAELYRRSPGGPTKQFAHRRMMALADYITRQWPSSLEAGDAWITLIHAAVVDDDIETALGYLDKLPSDSPRRGEAEVLLGRACWAQWIRAIQLDQSKRPKPEALGRMLNRARDLLASGVDRVAVDGPVDASLVAGVVALAQIHLQQNESDKAVALMDNPTVGLMTLARAKHPATAKEGYDVEIYKTALRAYVAAQQLDKAETVMDALEQSVAAGGDRQSASRLTEVYLSLSRELQDSLQLLRDQQRTDELLKMSRGFEMFLNRISKRTQGNTFNSLAWVAGTFADMGARFDTGGKTLPPEATKYYEHAVDVYRGLLERCRKEPSFAPDAGAIRAVQIRLARCLRRLYRFDEAMKLLVEVLARHNRMVDGQVEAAYTYQDWAATPGNAGKYLYAIQGGRRAKRKDGSEVNVVWGWGKLANLLLRSESRLTTFHEARYNLARCRFEYALTLDGQKKQDMLARTEKDIIVTELLSPSLGGPTWREKYDTLLKKVQSVQGKKPVGLKTHEKSKHP
ncbi:MAG: tetratricopeptide repeat protein [Pirellulales bacterium]|nr:tetratricopeptide repeat protein [Pirellulales bacterium]